MIDKKNYARTREGNVTIDYNLTKGFIELLKRHFIMKEDMVSGIRRKPLMVGRRLRNY